jgi:hypothetical protein
VHGGDGEWGRIRRVDCDRVVSSGKGWGTRLNGEDGRDTDARDR